MPKKWSELTPAQRHRRAARLARDPKTRASIPDEHLQGFKGADKLRAQRALNRRLDSPFVEGATVTNRQVARDRDAALDMQYAEPDRQLTSQIKDSQYHETSRLPAWFAEYQKGIQGAQARNQQNAQFFAGLTREMTAGDQTIQAATNQQIGQAQQQQAQVTGAPVDTSVQTAGNAASQIRQAMAESRGAGLIGQAAAQDRYLQDYGSRIVPGLQFAEQQRERGRRGELQAKRTDLARERGAAATKYMSDRRDAEQQATLERMVFGAETEQAKQKAQLDALNAQLAERDRQARRSDARADNRRADQQAERDAEKDAREAEKDRYQRENKLGPYKPAAKPDKPKRKTSDSVGQAYDGMQNWVNQFLTDQPGATRAQVVEHARRHHPKWFGTARQTLLTIALDLHFNPNGRVSANSRQKAKNIGLTVDSRGRVH